MAKDFSIGINTVEDVTFLKVAGVIDEDNTLAGSLRKIEGRIVVVDLSGVDRINSCGVRDWVNWLNDLESKNKQVILARCSPCIVNQINLVNNFTGGGMVKSFFAPYYCPRCDQEQLKLLQVEDFAGMNQPRAPEFRGEGCVEAQCEMQFDDIEASYFAFLPRNTGQVVDEKLKRLLDTFSPSIRDRIKRLDVVKERSDAGRTSLSATYSPLTVTNTGISINRDASSPEQPVAAQVAAGRRSGRSAALPLLGMALALVGAIVLYFLLVVVGH